jgi:hypothetical protein
MPPRKKARPRSIDTSLGILVDDHQAQAQMGINIHLLGTGTYGLDDEAAIHVTDSMLSLRGTCIHPEDRAGERFDVSLFASTPREHGLSLRIKDLHASDANGSPRYAKRRGVLEPVYVEPPPVARMRKIRGENAWEVYMRAEPQMITHGLLILAVYKLVYLTIHERRVSRKREVRSLGLQTTYPAEE